MDRGAWWATVHGVTKDRRDLATKKTNEKYICFVVELLELPRALVILYYPFKME